MQPKIADFGLSRVLDGANAVHSEDATGPVSILMLIVLVLHEICLQKGSAYGHRKFDKTDLFHEI